MRFARPPSLAAATLATGSVASLATFVGLAMAAEAEDLAPLRPINATSHWLNGDFAGLHSGADRRRTGVGIATNHAACLFWALPFMAWQRRRPAATPAALMRDALVMSAVAAAVDYGATPKRFTPGWELVLSKGGMVGAYAALAVGLAAGASLAARQGRRGGAGPRHVRTAPAPALPPRHAR